MSSIQASILECCDAAHDDNELIDKIEQLIVEKGDSVYPAIFSTFTSLELSVTEAKTFWTEMLEHRRKLCEALKRDVCLVSTVSDYLCSKVGAFKNPKIVDRQSFDRIVKESTHDSLTGLYNRAYFSETLEQHISSAKRQNTDLSVLFLDIDDFKEVNDCFGHHTGDLVLSAIADTIQMETRGSDIAARYGGEEFVVLMPHTDSLSGLVLAERIREKIAKKKFVLGGKTQHVTVSGGIATFPSHTQSAKDFLNLADSALYQAKGAGKNNISLYKEDKRRFLRIKFSRQIKIQELGFNDSQSFSATSKDICIGGVLFENQEPIAIGTKIQVSIPITPKKSILLIGTVVRLEAYAKDSYDIGMTISFKEMEKAATDEISKFLLKQSKKS